MHVNAEQSQAYVAWKRGKLLLYAAESFASHASFGDAKVTDLQHEPTALLRSIPSNLLCIHMHSVHDTVTLRQQVFS